MQFVTTRRQLAYADITNQRWWSLSCVARERVSYILTHIHTDNISPRHLNMSYDDRKITAGANAPRIFDSTDLSRCRARDPIKNIRQRMELCRTHRNWGSRHRLISHFGFCINNSLFFHLLAIFSLHVREIRTGKIKYSLKIVSDKSGL